MDRPSRSECTHVAISFRASREFVEWLDALAERNRVCRSVAIEHGALLLARESGFETPAPKR